MVLDRDGAGVGALGGKFLAEQHDRGDDFVADSVRVAGGASGAGINGFETAVMEAFEQSVDVLAGQPVGSGPRH